MVGMNFIIVDFSEVIVGGKGWGNVIFCVLGVEYSRGFVGFS